MKWKNILPDSIVVVGETTDKFALEKLQEDMVVQFWSFLWPMSPHRPNNGDDIVFRIRVCEVENMHLDNGPALYVTGFGNQPISAIKGNVTVPAEELFKLPCGLSEDCRERALNAVLYSELREVRFNFGRQKNSCSLWFRCLREQPSAIIPKAGLGNYFEPLPF